MLERKVKGLIITASTLVVALLLALSFGLIDMAWADTAPGNEPEMAEQASVGMVKLMALEPVVEAESELELFESEAAEEPVVLPSEDGLFVKIGLYYGSTAVSGINLSSSEGFLLAKNVDRSWVGTEDLSAYTTLDVRAENGAVNVYDAEGGLVVEALGADDVLMALGEYEERVVNIGTKACRDGAMFVNLDGRLNVINYVSMEHYIMGVVGREISSGNPLEALKAQAVASRSYALAKLGYHGKQGFDLCPTGDCQSYGAIAAETAMVTQAVKETEDQVITYDGKVATAFYFANSGGYTMNSEDVWTAAIPYLRAVQDDYAVKTVWNTQVTFAELKDKLVSKGYECGDITRVYVSSRCDNNAVRTLTIETTAGNINLSKEKLRSVLGTGLVKTSLFAVGADGFPGVGELAVAGSSGLVATSGEVSSATVYVMGEGEEVVEAETDDLYVTNGEDIVNSGEFVESTEAGELELTDEPVTNGTVYFSGVGNGHGVGLSQLSAIKMAGAPYFYTYDYILKFFYTGVEIQTISEIR